MTTDMRQRIEASIALLVLIAVLGCPGGPTAADERVLEDAVRENLDWSKFDRTKLDDHLVVLVAGGGGRQFFTRENIERFHADAKKNAVTYQASGFKIVKKDESNSSRYASVTYEVTWTMSSPQKKAETIQVVCREIWEHQVDGWHRLFAAVERR
jgi:hypothetical protein